MIKKKNNNSTKYANSGMNRYRQCNRCIMDTTVPDITFDTSGMCIFCSMHDTLDENHPLNSFGDKSFNKLIKKISNDGEYKEYDCIVGVSGGRDSTYTLYIAKKLGLRPLAVHFDNGWNSSIAVSNIRNATNALDIDLETVVADWEEFKDLQISFLRASVSDAEIPTDYAILSTLYEVASRNGITYILNGHSFRTEGVAPKTWTYMDGRYINSVHSRFGSKRITSFPIMTLTQFLSYTFIKKIITINLPEYIPYNHDDVERVLTNELGWTYYGGHHHESIYTEFFQSYYLPKKFGIDKRKLEYSALIRSGQMKREDALNEISKPYPWKQEINEYILEKLSLSQDEFDIIMKEKIKSFKDYRSYYSYMRLLKIPIRIGCTLHILPPIFYQKYLR